MFLNIIFYSLLHIMPFYYYDSLYVKFKYRLFKFYYITNMLKHFNVMQAYILHILY